MFQSPVMATIAFPHREPQEIDPGSPRKPNFTPINSLPIYRIPNYFQETHVARNQAQINSYGINYATTSGVHLRLIISGVTQEKIEAYFSKYRADQAEQAPIAFAMNAISQDEARAYGLYPTEREQQEHDGEEDSAENKPPSTHVPDFEDLKVHHTQTYADAYYARLLRERPYDIAITLEHLNPSRDGKDDSVIWYVIDPEITYAKETHHYYAKYQSGGVVAVSIENDGSGSATLEMWHRFRNENDNVRTRTVGTRFAHSNVPSPNRIEDWHAVHPEEHLCDVSVTGWQSGTVYTISGSWWRS